MMFAGPEKSSGGNTDADIINGIVADIINGIAADIINGIAVEFACISNLTIASLITVNGSAVDTTGAVHADAYFRLPFLFRTSVIVRNRLLLP